ncbi:MAG: hypothetical protein AB1489_01165 [Acidobacteriota bacterium]
MKAMKIVLLLFILPLFLSFQDRVHPASAPSLNLQRIQFNVRAVEENGGHRQVLSETLIEGPAGSDFDIKLQDSRFTLAAAFITDLIDTNLLQIRTQIATKRFIGYSQRKLPIYEEDQQQHKFLVGLDEAVELLPFGRSEEGNLLKIEIDPLIHILPKQTTDKPEPLKIDIVKSPQYGFIKVNAHKIPHRFVVDAKLLVNNVAIAHGSSNCLFQQPQEIQLTPIPLTTAPAAYFPLMLSINVDSYTRSCPSDAFSINFDLYQTDQINRVRQTLLAQNWAGAGNFGETLIYNLSEVIPGINNKCELVLTLRLAEE